MRGTILCTLLLLAAAPAAAAPDACEEKALPWTARSACLFVPVMENNHIIVGHGLVCADGVSAMQVDLGPTGLVVCYCTLPPGGPISLPEITFRAPDIVT